MKKISPVILLLLCAASLTADCNFDLLVNLPASLTRTGQFCPNNSEPYTLAFGGNSSGQFVMYFDDLTTSTRVDYINVSPVGSWSKTYNLIANHQYEVNLWSSAGGDFLAEPQ